MSKPTFLEPLIGKGAGQVELINAEQGTVLATQVEPAFDSKTRKKGLLGRDSVPEDYALILAPCSAVHTFSMRFPIDAVFVARNGTVTKTRRSVKPWRIAGDLRAHAVIEAAPGFIDRAELVPGEIVTLREIVNKRRATYALPPLPAAHPQVSGVAPRRHTTSHKRLTLADVVASKTPLAWFESVAIVQELCEAVIARGPDDDPRVPELKHIALTAEGQVTLLAEGPAEHSPVHRAGLVLLALTPDDQIPLQLRLLVLEEVSPRPRLNSIRDLHREFEFFERPDRQTIVQGVYQRFHEESAATAAQKAVPPPLLEPPPPKRHHRWWKRRSVWTGAWIVVTTLAAAAVIWAWPRPEGQWLRDGVSQVSKVALTESRKVAETVRREVNGASWRLGFRPRAEQRGVPVVALPSAGAGGAAPPPLGISRQGGTAAAPILPSDFAGLPQASPALNTAQATAPAAQTPAPAVGVAAGNVVAPYSAADAPRVIPPKLVSPQALARPPASASSQPGAPELELVVSAAGEVESVKLVSGRTTAPSGMQFSAVKAWRFEPAMRDGQPVRYRLRVQLPAR